MPYKKLAKLLAPLVMGGALLVSQAHAGDLSENLLMGRWHSNETKEGLARGEMVLSAHGIFSLQPEGLQALNGYWEATSSELKFYSPLQNKSVVNHYVLKGDKLVLTYPNGFKQTFTRDTSKPSANKTTAPSPKP